MNAQSLSQRLQDSWMKSQKLPFPRRFIHDPFPFPSSLMYTNPSASSLIIHTHLERLIPIHPNILFSPSSSLFTLLNSSLNLLPYHRLYSAPRPAHSTYTRLKIQDSRPKDSLSYCEDRTFPLSKSFALFLFALQTPFPVSVT